MTLYEVALLVAGVFGAFSFLSLASVLLDRGSVRVFMTFLVIAAGAAAIAHQTGEEGLNPYDIVPTIAKVVEMVRGA